MTLTDGKLERSSPAGGVSRGPGPELEYSRGTDSSPHNGSNDGCRVVPMGGAPETGGDTAGSGGEFTGFSTIDEFPTPLPAAEPVLHEGE